MGFTKMLEDWSRFSKGSYVNGGRGSSKVTPTAVFLGGKLVFNYDSILGLLGVQII